MVYYGSQPNFTCGVCSEVFTLHGPKWYILANLTESPAWQRLRLRGYEYIMLPGEDRVVGPAWSSLAVRRKP